MELLQIVNRYAEGLAWIDANTTVGRVNQRTKQPYLPGLKTLSEAKVIELLDGWWGITHSSDFITPTSHYVQIPYPGLGRSSCDQVFTTVGQEDPAEWAVEAKFLQLVGDNGKRNDFAVAKALSPYLKDRSLYHDVWKLRKNPIGRRLAVIGFSFTYSDRTCDEAQARHPAERARIEEIRSVCRQNEGALSVRPLVEFADGIFRIRELVVGQFARASFEAWRHPCGGEGVVFGWEVRKADHQPVGDDW